MAQYIQNSFIKGSKQAALREKTKAFVDAQKANAGKTFTTTPGPPSAYTPPPSTPYDGTTAAQAGSNPMFEAMYGNALTGADTTYNNQIADIQYGENRLGNDFGFALNRTSNGYVDAAASMAAGVDPSNPFSKMALLQRSYQQEKAGNTNSYAAQGQQNSGAYQRQAANAQFNNAQQDDALRKAFQDAIQASTSSRKTALETKTATGTAAAGTRLSNYLGAG